MTIRIILVDDHAIVRDGIRTLLSGDDELSVVAEASTGDEALKFVSTIPCDLVVMDVDIPPDNGFVVAGRIIEMIPAMKIIFLSMYNDVEYKRKGQQVGGVGYVGKDESGHHLINCIKHAIHDGITFFDIPEDNPPGTESRLSDREWSVALLIADGMGTNEIAERLFISPKTVSTHKMNIATKTGAVGDVNIAKWVSANRLALG